MQRTLLFAAVLAVTAGAFIPAQGATVDFVKDIQPILQDSCVKCHGSEKHKGDLRLDSKADAFKGGKDGQVITPGQADKSDLYRRVILPDGSDDIMPPKGNPLTKKQTDLIKDWINQGAVWPEGAVAKSEKSEEGAPTVNSIFAGMTPIKPSSAETSAITKLAATGIEVRPVAMNLTWRQTSFRTLGAKANDAAITPLKDIANLVELNLAGTKITDNGLQNIAGLTNLITLHLELTGITDAGLAHLKNLQHLSYLNLYGTAVTDKGLEQLKGLHNLKHLYLWQTKVTADGAAALQKALPAVLISRGWENEPGAKEEIKTAENKPMEKQAAEEKPAKKKAGRKKNAEKKEAKN